MTTHNFHWNVTGPMFNRLYLMFMGHYTEQRDVLDLIAERIRALGHPAPGTCKEFAKPASIRDADGVPRTMDVVRILVAAQEAIERTARKLFPLVDKAIDQPTADLLIQRGRFRKALLRSCAGRPTMQGQLNASASLLYPPG